MTTEARSGAIPALPVVLPFPRRTIPDTTQIFEMTEGSAELDRFIIDASPDGIIVAEPGGTVVYANPAAEALLGYERGTTEGMRIADFLPHKVRRRHEEDRAHYHAAPTARPMGLGRELNALRADGTLVPVEIALSPLPGTADNWVVATLRDVSERRELRSLGAATLAAAERERTRIAQELHDDVLQRLAAMLLSLRLISGRQDHPDADALHDLRERLEDSADRLRRLARGLRPSELQDVGLELALRRLVRELDEAGGPKVNFECEVSDHEVPEAVALALFRIVQEALWNAHRHARATVIGIAASCDGSRAIIVIHDDGDGFDFEVARRTGRGLGLRGMLERTAAVGGRLDIVSAPGEGTRLTAELPYGGDDAFTSGEA